MPVGGCQSLRLSIIIQYADIESLTNQWASIQVGRATFKSLHFLFILHYIMLYKILLRINKIHNSNLFSENFLLVAEESVTTFINEK